MDWKVIITLSTIGLIMGLQSVNGFTHKLEHFLWLLFGFATALVLSKNIDNKTFLHGYLLDLPGELLMGCRNPFSLTPSIKQSAGSTKFSKGTIYATKILWFNIWTNNRCNYRNYAWWIVVAVSRRYGANLNR